ncbi:hypothetical protein SAMN05216431_10890 [Ligilactobacillus sp. WC1T17]|uniref:DUF454 family protein n=1 Tax=Ligilactobacillus ruminis TaxID=1623 RepID=A0ABY1ACA8_9LACO|nr:hypothetical protein SAMN05216431_10890 [Ligilactobacillus ruminis]
MITRFLWLMLAIVMFVLSIIGLMLPVIPQVPFILAFLYSMSKFSPRFHQWLLKTRFHQWINHFLRTEKQKVAAKQKEVWYKTLWLKMPFMSKSKS